MAWNMDQLAHRLDQRFWETKDDKERELIFNLLSYYKQRDTSQKEQTDVNLEP